MLDRNASFQFEAAALSAAISSIYDAAIDPAKWTLALQRACDFCGGAQAVMHWQGLSADQAGTLYLYNDDPHYTRLFLEELAPLNPLFPAVMFQDVGAVVASSDLVPDDEMQKTRFHKEWIAPQGMTGSLAVLLERDATRAAFISFPWRGGPIDDDARERLALLVPHLQRAVAIGRLFARREASERTLTAALDHVDDGVLLLSARGQIVFANATGRRMLDEGGLLYMAGDVLHAVAPEAEQMLRDCLARIATGREGVESRGITVALSETSEPQWIANVLPLADGERRQAGDQHRAIAALFVRSSMRAQPSPIETFAKRYRLTASEIRVVETSMRISGLDAVASALGISRATVKTHLNRIYRKSSTRNRGDLIRLITNFGPT